MVKVKICGLFRPEDIAAVNTAKPDYIGFVFAKSRRQVTADQAAKLREMLSPEMISVGVFVNADIQQIASFYQDGIISIAQLHGNEDEAYLASLKQTCSIPVIKAIQLSGYSVKEAQANISRWESYSNADFLLLDSGAGSGETFDWKLTSFCRKPYFLAGGIHIGNIVSALKINPYCIDISSGVETEGLKDPLKIKKTVDTVKKEGSS